MTNEDWQYLTTRLESIGGCLKDAALYARATLEATSDDMDSPEHTYSICHAVWLSVSEALDHEDFDLIHKPAVYALEAEMAGRVLSYRLQKGWLIRSPNAPVNQ